MSNRNAEKPKKYAWTEADNKYKASVLHHI